MDRTEKKFTEKNIHRRKNGRKIGWKFFIFLCFLAIISFFLWRKKPEEKNTPERISNENIIITESEPEKIPEKKTISHIVAEGDIPADVFSEYGKFDANDMEAIISAGKDIYDFSNIKIGKTIDFIFGEGVQAEEVRYFPDTENRIIAKKENGEFNIIKEKMPYETKEEILSIKIDEFLYKDALDAGLSEPLILDVADVFSFDIDFTTDIREGDELKIIYEKRTLDGKPAPDGKVLAAKFINSKEEYFAYYFESNGAGSHYDSEGHELLRQFLKAPLNYRYISSGFTGARLHPITKKVSAHYQIDYAAPTGTPVSATARGTVVSAHWETGWGNIVRLKHDNGYTTHYGHLSAFRKGIRSGVSVSQGQLIGYVGSTGWSTGPHLDYGMKLNGVPINPLSLKLPKGNPLSGEEMDKFKESKNKYDEILKK